MPGMLLGKDSKMGKKAVGEWFWSSGECFQIMLQIKLFSGRGGGKRGGGVSRGGEGSGNLASNKEKGYENKDDEGGRASWV